MREDRPPVTRAEVETMTFRSRFILTAFLLIPAALAPWEGSAAAQTEAPSVESRPSESTDDLSEESVDLVSDVERLLRHERVMDLDRTRLSYARARPGSAAMEARYRRAAESRSPSN